MASMHNFTDQQLHFSGIYGHAVPKSAVRRFRDAYHVELKAQSIANSGPVGLPCKPKGRLLPLGNLDKVRKQYIMRAAGGVANVRCLQIVAVAHKCGTRTRV